MTSFYSDDMNLVLKWIEPAGQYLWNLTLKCTWMSWVPFFSPHHLKYFFRVCAQHFNYLKIWHITDHSTVRCNLIYVFVFLSQLIQCLIKNALCLWKRLALSGTVSVSSSSCYRGESSSVFTFCTYLLIFKHQRDRPLGECAPCWAHQKGQLGQIFHAYHSVRCEKLINLTYDSRLFLFSSLNMT